MSDVTEILKERGSKYGQFKYQANCVGEIIDSLEKCAEYNNLLLTYSRKGAFAYMAIKLARYAVGETDDTLTDLEGYARLIKEMEHEVQ